MFYQWRQRDAKGFCDKPEVTPVLPTKAMIDDDDGTVSEAMEAMVQDNNDVLMDTMVNDNNDGIDCEYIHILLGNKQINKY